MRARVEASPRAVNNVGEVLERLNRLVSKTSVPYGYRGFESHPLRHKRVQVEPGFRVQGAFEALCSEVARIPDACSRVGSELRPLNSDNWFSGEMRERLNRLDWKSSVAARSPGVRIPLSPPKKEEFRNQSSEFGWQFLTLALVSIKDRLSISVWYAEL